MIFWFPFQLYFIYKFFFNKEWKVGFGKRHWLFRGFVYLMMAGGIWNIFSALVWILVALIG